MPRARPDRACDVLVLGSGIAGLSLAWKAAAFNSGVFRTVATIAGHDPRFRIVCMVDTMAALERTA